MVDDRHKSVSTGGRGIIDGIIGGIIDRIIDRIIRASCVALAVSLGGLACGPRAAPPEVPALTSGTSGRPVSAETERASTTAEAPALHYALRPEVETQTEGEAGELPEAWIVTVRAHAPGEALLRWSLGAPAGLCAPEVIDASDAAGPLRPTLSGARGRTLVTLDRAPSAPLLLRYRLRGRVAGEGRCGAGVGAAGGDVSGSAEADFGPRDPALSLAAQHLVVDADALLLRPDALATIALPIEVEVDPALVDPAPTENPEAPPQLLLATTLGLGGLGEASDAPPVLRPEELLLTTLIAGPLEWARFDGFGGNDRFASIGPAVFDVRWAAAEIAGLRSAVDLYFGFLSDAPYTTLVSLRRHAPHEPPFVVRLRSRGLLVRADDRASWGATARMSVGQALVQRWLGGRVRLLEAPDQEPGAELLWFSGGVARFVAWRLLYGLGALSDEEYTGELNAWERALVTSLDRDRSRADLALLAEGQGRRAEEARALLVARGALHALELDAEIAARSQGSRALGVVVSAVVARALDEERRDLPRSTWIESADAELGEPTARRFVNTIDRGLRPELGTRALGPCFRPSKTSYRRFDLGFRDLTRADAAAPRIADLDLQGPAARAGLRAEDGLVSLEYAPGDPDTEVTLEVIRDGEPLVLRYFPAGPKQPGVGWRRIDSVPDELC